VATLRDTDAVPPPESELFLCANGLLDFRATLGAVVDHQDGSASISSEVGAALNLKPTDKLWFSPLR
jgi:hypothetical protein